MIIGTLLYIAAFKYYILVLSNHLDPYFHNNNISVILIPT